MPSIRPPAVAGTFYPSRAAELAALVEDLLAEAGPAAAGPPPKALIAPHAGYVYSGPVAARAFRALGARTSRIRRVVMIGPSHFVPVRGLALPSSDGFATPLGAVAVDRATLEALRDLPHVRVDDRAHADEHALEVELPFLQAVLENFTIVPLVVGAAAPEEVAAAVAPLWGSDETLIVVSSDLSHYHGYDTARRLDEATAGKIERLEAAELGAADACGFLPVAGLLIEARARGLEVSRLDLRNSGDTAGTPERVVGYGAWAFRP